MNMSHAEGRSLLYRVYRAIGGHSLADLGKWERKCVVLAQNTHAYKETNRPLGINASVHIN